MIELREITMANFRECLALEVNDYQKGFVARNIYSLAEARADNVSNPRAIYAGKTMVGFIMYDFDPATGIGWITRLMVDKNHQGKGYGRAAMVEVSRRLRAYSGCRILRTSINPENIAARALYTSLGFKFTGEKIDDEEVCDMVVSHDSDKVADATGGIQVERRMEKDVVRTIGMDYLLYLPSDYDHMKKWPLVLFLHGAGERGRRLDSVKRHGPPKLVSEGRHFPFILVSPQCPAYNWWNDVSDKVMEVLDEVTGLYNVDSDRIYITGLSMGGFGTFDITKKYPDLFAAAVPICGGVKTTDGLEKIKDIPFWVFHGKKDPVVPIKASEAAVEGLKELGANVEFTVYPDLLHDSWTKTYKNPIVYEWMLYHRKKKNGIQDT